MPLGCPMAFFHCLLSILEKVFIINALICLFQGRKEHDKCDNGNGEPPDDDDDCDYWNYDRTE